MLEFFDSECECEKTPSMSSSKLSSPKNMKRLQCSIEKVKKNLKDIEDVLDEASPSLNKKINKIFNGSLMQAELSAQQGSDLDRYLEASHNCKQKTTHWRINVGGPLYVKDANHRIEEQKATEMRDEWEKRERHRARDEKKRQRELTEEARTGEINGGVTAAATGDQENLPFFVDTQPW